jgi:hypothetical protein
MDLKWQQKERKYFDSGDFALAATSKTTDNGIINTGVTHPHRENISRPHTAVPANSNVQEDANENLQDRKSGDFVMTGSPLGQHTDQQSKKTRESPSHWSYMTSDSGCWKLARFLKLRWALIAQSYAQLSLYLFPCILKQ